MDFGELSRAEERAHTGRRIPLFLYPPFSILHSRLLTTPTAMPKILTQRPPRKHVWNPRRVTDAPAPPPALGPRVVLVRFRPLESDGALWVFSGPIEDPDAGAIAQLAIAGLTAISFDRVDATSLIVWYDSSLAPGQAWSNVQGAAGIVGADDALPLAAGSGTVAVPVEQVVTVNRLDEQ